MIEIGKVVKPQGIKGEIKIILNCDADRINNIEQIIISGEKFNIEEKRIIDNNFIIKLKDINSRNDAEKLRNLSVFALREELKCLEENEYYYDDLIGLKVYNENNEEIGIIEDIDQFGSADIIYIRERNILFSVPFIDTIFKSISENSVIVFQEEYDNFKIND